MKRHQFPKFPPRALSFALFAIFSLFVQLQCEQVHAGASSEWKRMISARSRKQLRESVFSPRAGHRAEACTVQLRRDRIPFYCFDLVEPTETDQLEWMLEVCRDRASRTTDMGELRRAFRILKRNGLGTPCLDVIQQRRADLRYAAVTHGEKAAVLFRLDRKLKDRKSEHRISEP